VALEHEEALQPLLGHVRLDRLRVEPLARGGERALVEVGGEDLDRRMLLLPRRLLEH
jgi:hypothetical protein